ncbi:MAG: Uma2 family endonuclease [Limnothrix sp. RL_2_0]|nr:Uma2 family endonuclease [Limnothrix sp. RL_2_0]
MVISPSPTAITFHDFFEQYSEDDRIELIDGELFELEPKGPHEEVAAFIDRKLNVQIDCLNLNYFVLQRGLLKPAGEFTAFRPDIMVINRNNLIHEPLWEKQSVITSGQSVKLIAEVVSSNCQNEHTRKLKEYAELKIPEYWILDYEDPREEKFIGKVQESILTVNILINSSHEKKVCSLENTIESYIFSQSKLFPSTNVKRAR